MKLARLSRKAHYWASLFIALPLLIVIGSGLLLQLKKEWSWIQPSTQRGSANTPALSFDQILSASGFADWGEVDRLDVRPGKGVVKVRGNNRWEVQIDTATGEVLQKAYRRSDLIESIHDGSFFHPMAKLWIFLPAAVVLFVMWVTGIYLFLIPFLNKRRRGYQFPKNPGNQAPKR